MYDVMHWKRLFFFNGRGGGWVERSHFTKLRRRKCRRDNCQWGGGARREFSSVGNDGGGGEAENFRVWGMTGGGGGEGDGMSRTLIF